MNTTNQKNNFYTSEDFLFKGMLILGGIYLLSVSPMAFGIGAIAIVFTHMTRRRIKIKTLALMVATGMMTLYMSQPAHAVILTDMEAFMVDLAADAGTSITADQVGLIFTLMRAVFLILIVIAALFAYNQAQQGNDWRPIATQAGMAIGVLISLDAITNLFTT